MGGLQKGLGKIYQPVRKVIDPLNIMDPFNILPGATLGGGRKPFSFDKNYGGPLKNLFGGGGGSTYTPQRSTLNTSGMFSTQNPMLENMQAQYATSLANLKSSSAKNFAKMQTNTQKMQASNEALRSSSPLFAPPEVAPSTSLAQLKSNDTLVGTDFPVEFIYKQPSNQQSYVASNTFSIPNMSDIKFGGV